MASEKVTKLLEDIKALTVLECSELVKEIEEAFGVSAAAPAEEQTEFTVVLENAGANKIGVIKVVREITALGLKEAKELVDGVPKPIKENIQKDEAEAIAAKLKEAGATVAVK